MTAADVGRLEAAIDRLTELLTGEAERRTPMLDAGMLTVKEAAEILRWSEDTVRRRCHIDLPCIRHGNSYRIPRHALEQWLLKDAS